MTILIDTLVFYTRLVFCVLEALGNNARISSMYIKISRFPDDAPFLPRPPSSCMTSEGADVARLVSYMLSSTCHAPILLIFKQLVSDEVQHTSP